MALLLGNNPGPTWASPGQHHSSTITNNSSDNTPNSNTSSHHHNNNHRDNNHNNNHSSLTLPSPTLDPIVRHTQHIHQHTKVGSPPSNTNSNITSSTNNPHNATHKVSSSTHPNNLLTVVSTR